MEWSHFISDAVLMLVGVFVFFRYLSGLDLDETLLWESFVLSVTAAAIFGALRYAGVNNADYFSSFFQTLAATAGAVGLVTIAWLMALGIYPNNTITYVVLTIGFALFATAEAFNIKEIVQFTPLICIPLVAVAALVAMFNGKVRYGSFLLAAVVFIALAMFRDSFVSNTSDAIDVYHYLMAIALLCVGLAAYSVRRKLKA